MSGGLGIVQRGEGSKRLVIDGETAAGQQRAVGAGTGQSARTIELTGQVLDYDRSHR